MLRLKVNSFIMEHRKTIRENQLLKNRLNFKFQNQDVIITQNIQNCKFNEDQLKSLCIEAFKNQTQCLQEKTISKFVNFYNNDGEQVIKHFSIILPILEVLTKKHSSSDYQTEQLKAEIFFIDVLKFQQIELIDSSINGLYNLFQIPQSNQLYKRETLILLLDLLNLQIADIAIDKVSYIIIKLITNLNHQEIPDQIKTQEFNNSLIYYLKIDKDIIINLIMHIINKQITLQLFSNFQFFDFLLECLDIRDHQQLMKVVYFIKYTIFEISCKNEYLLENKLSSILRLGHESLNKQIQDIFVILKREKQQEHSHSRGIEQKC